MVVQVVHTGRPMSSSLPPKRSLESKSEWEARCLKKRNTDILDAMASYVRDKMLVPSDWVMELSEHLARLGATDDVLIHIVRLMQVKSQKGERIGVRRVENLAKLVYQLKLAIP